MGNGRDLSAVYPLWPKKDDVLKCSGWCGYQNRSVLLDTFGGYATPVLGRQAGNCMSQEFKLIPRHASSGPAPSNNTSSPPSSPANETGSKRANSIYAARPSPIPGFHPSFGIPYTESSTKLQ
ncbi:hypothetical protein PM082_022394 [Marasmius tenuissimus]|nr:hypothetical protein PM082_022394 [Marasmius tenuissimus]